MARAVVHLDVDAFFASVEQRDDPKLRGRPVAVGAGVVASCSYESRRYGVRTGMRLAEARRLCRPLIVLPGEYPKYEMAARQILGICHDVTPVVEVAALDDLYLDLSQKGASEDTLGPVADALRAQVREEIGLSVSLGVGANKLISRVATNEAKPGRRVIVPAGAERSYLAPWPADVLPGVGPKTYARLARLNVHTVGEVALMPAAVLRGLFGVQGRQIHGFAHGIDDRPVDPHKFQQTVSRSTSFDPPEADRGFLKAMVCYLLERSCSWLRFRGLATRGLSLTIRYGDYRGETGRESFRRPVRDEAELREAARERFERLYQRRLPLRYVGVELAPLGPPDCQPALFPDPDEEKRKRLLEVKDEIRKKFGFTAIGSGETLLLDEKLQKDRGNYKMRTACLTR